MIRTIMLATDGSDHARRAAEWAGDLAAKYGAEVVVAHVMVNRKVPEALRRMAEIEHLVEPATRVRPAPVAGPTVVPEEDEDARILAALSEKILQDAESVVREKGATRVRTVALDGEAADALVAHAEKIGADLVVVGRRGLGELGALLLGSVSHKLIQLAPCPVLTVR
jgi:nucleotide-binding universal stress UspA family protein